LIGWKIEEERVTVIKARMNKRCDNYYGSVSMEIKVCADATEFSNVNKEDLKITEMRSDMERVKSKITPWCVCRYRTMTMVRVSPTQQPPNF
jgi:hypothetical protein